MTSPPTRRTTPPTALRADPDAPLTAVSAGTVPYGIAWDWQRQLVTRRAEGQVGDVLLTLQHPPVYTLGRRANDEHLVFDASERARRGIELYRVDRGGDVTYHGPGQLVGYPILQLGGPFVVDYVRLLEEVLIRLAATFGLPAERVPGYTGVWVGGEKLAAIGVRVSSRRITNHGFAFNVATDLSDFDGIVPCGIRDRGVCSLRSLGIDTTVAEVEAHTHAIFAQVVGATLVRATPEELGLVRAAPASA